MKSIILEGIATSGKTSVKNLLSKTLTEQNINFSIFEESQTLMPVLNNSDKNTSLDFLKTVINQALSLQKDLIIFDRLFFSHIFRTKSTMSDYRDIEKLFDHQCFLAFLKIDETEIPQRIAKARIHRGQEWDNYVGKKGDIKQVNEYYIGQQKQLLDLVNQTTLTSKIYDTTTLDFEKIAQDILTINKL
ncbi:hypothetical protein IT412_05640 [Candidatus Peregrinibacteria bacterium]|nr:hypothetical protein [Candidatus Peregrinibacteria bacterium]